MYEKILVPVDGSAASQGGLAEALRLARLTGARLRLVHVIDQSVAAVAADGAPRLETLLDAMREAGRRLLGEAAHAAHAAGIEADTQLFENLRGRIADAIVEQAAAWPADLVVMGTHGRRGFSHFLLGSDAEAVVRTSPVPVLLVRERARSALAAGAP